MFEKLRAKRRIAHLDLRSVRDNVIQKMGWSPEQAENVELEYRRFLYALAQKRRDEIISHPHRRWTTSGTNIFWTLENTATTLRLSLATTWITLRVSRRRTKKGRMQSVVTFT